MVFPVLPTLVYLFILRVLPVFQLVGSLFPLILDLGITPAQVKNVIYRPGDSGKIHCREV